MDRSQLTAKHCHEVRNNYTSLHHVYMVYIYYVTKIESSSDNYILKCICKHFTIYTVHTCVYIFENGR